MELTKRAQNMPDDAVYKLVGKIIRQAVRDLYADSKQARKELKKAEEKLKLYKKNPKEYKKKIKNATNKVQYCKIRLNQIEYDRGSAELFFKKSKLFALSGINFEYLQEKKDDILSMPEDEE